MSGPSTIAGLNGGTPAAVCNPNDLIPAEQQDGVTRPMPASLLQPFPTTRGQIEVVGQSKYVCIAKRSDNKDGSGSSLDPYNGNTTGKLDEILSNPAKTPPGALIHLPNSDDIFTTKGSPVAWGARSGWRMILGKTTTMRLDVLTANDIAGLPADKKVQIFGGAAGTLPEDVEVEGGIWDCNAQGQVENVCAAAIQLQVDGLKVRRVKAINWGSKTTGECFVIGAFSNGNTWARIHKNGILIEECELTQPAAIAHTGTISLINPCGGQNVADGAAPSNGWFEGVTVRNCYLHDITLTDVLTVACINLGGWVKGFTGHGNRFLNITGHNARNGYYMDTGSCDAVRIGENDQFINCNAAVRLVGAAGYIRKGVVLAGAQIRDCAFGPIQLFGFGTNDSDYTIRDIELHVTLGAGFGIQWENIQGIRFRDLILDITGSYIVNNTPGSGLIWQYENVVDGTGRPVPAEGSAVAQATNVNTGVTVDRKSGVITTQAATTAANGVEAGFAVTNNKVRTTSKVLARVVAYSGTYGTNGLPDVVVDTVNDGNFHVRVVNNHGTNALNGTMKIHFQIL